MTYATQFALESLSLVGETYENSHVAQRACDMLVHRQRADGGWGESYKVRRSLIRCNHALLIRLATLSEL
jgi:squalene cyclase